MPINRRILTAKSAIALNIRTFIKPERPYFTRYIYVEQNTHTFSAHTDYKRYAQAIHSFMQELSSKISFCVIAKSLSFR